MVKFSIPQFSIDVIITLINLNAVALNIAEPFFWLIVYLKFFLKGYYMLVAPL